MISEKDKKILGRIGAVVQRNKMNTMSNDEAEAIRDDLARLIVHGWVFCVVDEENHNNSFCLIEPGGRVIQKFSETKRKGWTHTVFWFSWNYGSYQARILFPNDSGVWYDGDSNFMERYTWQ